MIDKILNIRKKNNKGKVIFKILNGIIDYSSISFFVLLFIFVTLQVILRYVFNNPIAWSEELARFSMIWLAFLGSIIAMRENKHIRIDILEKYLPNSAREIVNMISKFISLIFLCILFYYSVKKVILNFNIRSTVTEWSLGIIYLCIPISALGMIFYLLFFKKEN